MAIRPGNGTFRRMKYAVKSAIKSGLDSFGIEIKRNRGGGVGELVSFLENIRARGFIPRGIVDVGANRGAWTRLALSIFPNASVIMIEPQDEMEPYLSKLCSSLPTCRYIKAGAGRKPGELVQTIWSDLNGSSFLPPVDRSQLGSGKQRKTQIVTIDSVLAETYPGFLPDLVKLDIQGFELEALSGAQNTTFGRTELFILETSLFSFLPRQPLTREVISFMFDRGYELYDITGYQRRPFDGALGQVDLAFVKSKGRFRSEANW
ncbi:MAG: FkbM family methyltransferase [Verrucomicrobia bacterium]|nr:FkbM family methyltransferase [Verrucomicrobiota bacterium]